MNQITDQVPGAMMEAAGPDIDAGEGVTAVASAIAKPWMAGLTSGRM
jgi:hypothetical protein